MTPDRVSRSLGRAVSLRVLLCAAALLFGVSVAHGQWLEKVIYLPDSLSGVLWPSRIAANPSFTRSTCRVTTADTAGAASTPT